MTASAGTGATEAHRRGLRDGATAARAGAAPRAVDPYGLVQGRYAAQYGNGWEHGYVFAKREMREARESAERTRGARDGR
jgi:hypothetical protein